MKEIFHRVSIRQFEDKPVEEEKITELLRAAMQAPSSGNQQPWEFYVVTNKEVLQSLATVHPYAGPAGRAPVVIVPVSRKEGKFPECIPQDMSIATEHLWLMADTLGLGGVWMAIAPLQDRMDRVREILQIPDALEAFALFAFGYPAESKTQENRFEEDRIHYVR